MSGMRSKSSFFRSLELLDCSDDSPDDEDSLEQLLARARAETSNLTVASSNAEPLTLTRANTAPSPSYTDKELQQVIVSHGTHHRMRPQLDESNLRTVKRSQTTGTIPSTMTGPKRGGGPVSKKRRTNSIIKLVPEEQRIFKELVFCKRSRKFGLSHFILRLSLSLFPK